MNPYQSAAATYVMQGWAVFPVPFAKKGPPPKGVTGVDGVDPEEEQMLLEWIQEGGNIALKMHEGVIGVDVDGVEGFATFKALENKLGALPIETVSTSHRRISEGFTAFFRVPVGIKFKGQAGRHIDLIQRHHRYQVVAPSVHPDSGRVYEWKTYLGGHSTPFIPDVEDLPTLPPEWVEFLRVDPAEGVDPETQGVDPKTLEEALGGVGCSLMKKILFDRGGRLKKSGGRHDEMVKGVWAMVNEGCKGHTGAGEALEKYMGVWLSCFTPEEVKTRDIRAEFLASVLGAQSKVLTAYIGNCSCGSYKAKTKNRSFVTGQKMWRY